MIRIMQPAAFVVTYVGRTDHRSRQILFGVHSADRLFHTYALGKTGTGKSTLLETLIRQDIAAGNGLCLIDPHGDLVERVAYAVPSERLDDLHYLNMPNATQPFGYNPLRKVRPSFIPLAASGIMEAFKKHWEDAWGVRMEHILRNAVYALLENDGATLPDILRLLRDKHYRQQIAAGLRNEQVKDFWRL